MVIVAHAAEGKTQDGRGGRMSTRVWVRRAYDEPSPNDGYRVLVDRIWPRGVAKDRADIDLWLRDIAPSDELRHWFGHKEERWPEFRDRYQHELAEKEALVEQLASEAAKHRVTLVFGARDTRHNNAIVLRDLIETRLGAPPSSRRVTSERSEAAS
jgi:uncharacterized protein YeaO (DUF488 family)